MIFWCICTISKSVFILFDTCRSSVMHTDHVKYERRVCACFQHDLKKILDMFVSNFLMIILICRSMFMKFMLATRRIFSAPKCIYEDVKIVSLLLLFSNRVKIHFFVMASVNQHNWIGDMTRCCLIMLVCKLKIPLVIFSLCSSKWDITYMHNLNSSMFLYILFFFYMN